MALKVSKPKNKLPVPGTDTETLDFSENLWSWKGDAPVYNIQSDGYSYDVIDQDGNDKKAICLGLIGMIIIVFNAKSRKIRQEDVMSIFKLVISQRNWYTMDEKSADFMAKTAINKLTSEDSADVFDLAAYAPLEIKRYLLKKLFVVARYRVPAECEAEAERRIVEDIVPRIFENPEYELALLTGLIIKPAEAPKASVVPPVEYAAPVIDPIINVEPPAEVVSFVEDIQPIPTVNIDEPDNAVSEPDESGYVPFSDMERESVPEVPAYIPPVESVAENLPADSVPGTVIPQPIIPQPVVPDQFHSDAPNVIAQPPVPPVSQARPVVPEQSFQGTTVAQNTTPVVQPPAPPAPVFNNNQFAVPPSVKTQNQNASPVQEAAQQPQQWQQGQNGQPFYCVPNQGMPQQPQQWPQGQYGQQPQAGGVPNQSLPQQPQQWPQGQYGQQPFGMTSQGQPQQPQQWSQGQYGQQPYGMPNQAVPQQPQQWPQGQYGQPSYGMPNQGVPQQPQQWPQGQYGQPPYGMPNQGQPQQWPQNPYNSQPGQPQYGAPGRPYPPQNGTPSQPESGSGNS